jgi:hypothetical protein
MRRRIRGDDGGIAENFRLLARCRPGDNDLRLGQKQRLRAIEIGLDLDESIARCDFVLSGARSRAHQRDRGHHGKAQDRGRERQGGEFVAIQARQCAEIRFDPG